MIATSTVCFGDLPASSSRYARSTLMPGMWSAVSSSSCQLRGASVTVTAGKFVVAAEAAGGAALGALAAGVDAGVGEVATVAGAPHATIASDRRTSGDDNDLIGDPG